MNDMPKELQYVLIAGREDPILFIETLLGIPLHEGQKKYLREVMARHTRRNLLSCANRWGKSVLIASLQVWYLFYKFGIPEGNRESWLKAEYRTANIAPHSALTEPVFKTIDHILTSRFVVRQPDGTAETNKCLVGWFYIREKTLNTPPYKQFFVNNSYIEHRSLGSDQGDSLQGRPYGIITYDEAARSDHLDTELSDSILPRLFDWRAPLHLLSTPSQDSPSTLYYYQLYQEGLLGVNRSYTQKGSLRENTFFSPEQIQEQYDMFADDPLGPQILEGEFVFGGDTLFDADSILAAKDEGLNDGVRYEDGHTYAVGVDTAIGSDEMVYTVLDTTTRPFRLVRMVACKGNSKSPQVHLNDFLDLVYSYRKGSNLRILLETWNGESARFYTDLPYDLQAITQCYGAWQPTRRKTDNENPITNKTKDIKKAEIVLALKKLLAAGEIRVPANNEKLLQQLSIYKEKDDRLPNDRVISLCLASWMATEGQVSTKLVPQAIQW